MAENKYMLISLDDKTGQSKTIAEVLSSSTCKKIINYLAEVAGSGGVSQKDLSVGLKIPLNTIEYNIKKLISSGFIQKRKNFFWSKKGKKIIMYELSNKSIVISHKKKVSEKIKSILPAFIVTLSFSFAIWVYEKIKFGTENLVRVSQDDTIYAMAESANQVSQNGFDIFTPQPTPLWAWFLAGSLLTILIISIVNWRKL